MITNFLVLRLRQAREFLTSEFSFENTTQEGNLEELFRKSSVFTKHTQRPTTMIIRKNAFNNIFAVGLIMGLPLPPQSLMSGSKDLSFSAKIWCSILTAIKTFLFIVSALNIYRVIFTLASQITFYLFSICGFINMWIIVRSRKSVILAIRNICEFSQQLLPHIYIGSKSTKLELLLLVFAVTVLVGIQTVFFFEQEWETSLSSLKISVIEHTPYMNAYVWIVTFSVVMTFNISSATCYLMLLICYNSYCVLNKIMNFYGLELKSELNRGICNHKQMSRYISLYITITQRVREIDEALGTSAFFLFVTVICSFFNSISVVLANSQSYRTPVVDAYVVWATLTALVTFLLLTFSGAQVQKGHDNIKQAMTECSHLVAQLSPNLKTTLTFTLLVENIKGSNIAVTGWDMFTIRKDLVLTVLGLMMTYGVLMYQMDALKTE
ncbi:hypothetical protein AVEN_31144-1 [Araneus ventricosus]|uniref:Gustatory receptor n=1 Tax=Araneus ventricosus TaxID=182803 RepID=A0A4Y2NW28_ARAVE|nr:hypothetical protein AVEN_31144-1 [Araneus ventricosus]